MRGKRDGTLHTCRGTNTGTKKVETLRNSVTEKPLSLEDLDARLRKVEGWLKVFSSSQSGT